MEKLWRMAGVTLLGMGFLSMTMVLRAADPLSDPALQSALVPGADLVIVVDSAGWNQTPIQKKLDALKKEAIDSGLNPQAVKFKGLMDKSLKTLGIAEEDLKGVVISARVQGVTDSPNKPTSPRQAFEQLGVTIAFSLAKPITSSAVQKALNAAGAESGHELMFEKGGYNGAETLSVVVPDLPEGAKSPFPHDMLLALVDGGKAGYLGLEPQVKAAVDRHSAKKNTPLSKDLLDARKSALKNGLSYVLFVSNSTLRDMAKTRAAAMQQGNPMMAGAMQALGGLRHVSLSATGADAIQARAVAGFEQPAQAAQIKSIVDMMVLGMLKMMLMQSLGHPIPLLETLQSNQAENLVSINATVTETDLKALMELRAKKGAGGGGPPAPPAPPAPPQAPK